MTDPESADHGGDGLVPEVTRSTSSAQQDRDDLRNEENERLADQRAAEQREQHHQAQTTEVDRRRRLRAEERAQDGGIGER